MTFLTILEVTGILCSFRLLLHRKTGKQIAEYSRLKCPEKISENNFASLDKKYNTYRPSAGIVEAAK